MIKHDMRKHVYGDMTYMCVWKCARTCLYARGFVCVHGNLYTQVSMSWALMPQTAHVL